ncbi:hypothetical protein OH491_21740 [Termitidicoccus mucosus]|uniref:Uncharacterized protein n=1 Tax=Termitidicoccus mucosus TaxID=1184151 RepID=A0A178IC75_9BACT|nr:hypothetical protein AW736_21975 [Opitutaceae bacterium TSB47]
MKNEEKIAALGAEIQSKLVELLTLAREDGLLVDTVYPYTSVEPGRSSIYSSWTAHSGFGTCATGRKTPLDAIKEADSEARYGGEAVAKMRKDAADLIARATRLEDSIAPLCGSTANSGAYAETETGRPLTA